MRDSKQNTYSHLFTFITHITNKNGDPFVWGGVLVQGLWWYKCPSLSFLLRPFTLLSSAFQTLFQSSGDVINPLASASTFTPLIKFSTPHTPLLFSLGMM